MPSVDANKNILSAGASYAAEDWASVGAEASLDFRLEAQLRRGVDIGIGAEAGVRIEGGLQKYLSADVRGQASAAASVRAQVEVPLDLFDEAGLAVRLQAVAEAAVGVSLGVGLKAGDFLALAKTDPRMRGVPLELLKLFLEECDIQGGVMGKVAAAAMAYANLAITGRLIASGGELPGFTVAAEAGVGLKAGAGFRVHARFKVADPRRLLRRSIDIAVDGGIDAVLPLLADERARRTLVDLRTPAKIAFRTAFEVGLTLTENQGNFSAADGGKIALRCVQVALEEAQRAILERAVDFASRELRAALRDLGFSDATWQTAGPERRALGDRLRAQPEEPFEATQANRDYWSAVASETLALAAALSGGNAVPVAVRAPLALLWSATQLLFVCVERISVASARASVIGMSPVQASAPFVGNVAQPPAAIREHINSVLERAAGTAVDQSDIVRYLLEALRDSSLRAAPEIAGILDLVMGPGSNAGAQALDALFSNLGAFVLGADGSLSAQATLGVFRNALRAFVDERITGELRPALLAAAAGNRDAANFLDEVVIATLRTVTGPLFDTVLAWGSGDQDNQRALRELCSSLLMRLLGRSLVVASDVLTVKAQETIQGELRRLAGRVDDSGGAAPTLAAITRLDRAFIAELLEDTLLICADSFEPMTPERRARVRDLLYQIIDTAPAPDNADAVAELRNAALIPNAEAAFELARLMGEEIAGNVVRFVQALLLHVGMRILEELQAAIRAVQEAVEEWIEGLQQLAQDLARKLVMLLGEIDRLGRELEEAGDRLLGDASALLGFISSQTRSRTRLRDAVSDLAADSAVGVLRGIDAYSGLPKGVRQWARDRVRELVGGMLDSSLFDPLLDAVSHLSGEAAEFLDDLRAIEPGDDVASAVADLFLDRLEDAVRDIFGHSNPRLSLAFEIPVINVPFSFDVELPLASLVSAVRGAVRALDQFGDTVDRLVQSLVAAIDVENALRAAEDAHAALDGHREQTDRHLAESRAPAPALTILSPQPGAALEGQVMVTLRVEGISEAYLGLKDGEQQRLFIWANQHELPPQSFQVSAQAGRERAAFGVPAPLRLDTAPALHQLVAQGAANRVRGQGERSSKAALAQGAGKRLAVQAGLAGRAGMIERVHGKTLWAPPAGGKTEGYLPGRWHNPERGAFTPEREALTIRVTLPASVLHDGINSLVCAIVPGAAQRRVEQVVSFLLTMPRTPAKAGAITMPGRLAWYRDGLTSSLQAELAGRFGPSRLASGMVDLPPDVPALAEALWYPPKAERMAVVARTTAALKIALPVETRRIAELRAVVEAGALRPVVIAPALRDAQAKRKSAPAAGREKGDAA